MAMIKVDFNCCLCSESFSVIVGVPDEWSFTYDSVDVENAFCPEHAPISEWTDSQCPGCVGTWMDCEMWRSFAYSEGRNLKAEELETIKQGICPRRVGGTFEVKNGNVTAIDISEVSSSGEALQKAISDYWDRYSIKDGNDTVRSSKKTSW